MVMKMCNYRRTSLFLEGNKQTLWFMMRRRTSVSAEWCFTSDPLVEGSKGLIVGTRQKGLSLPDSVQVPKLTWLAKDTRCWSNANWAKCLLKLTDSNNHKITIVELGETRERDFVPTKCVLTVCVWDFRDSNKKSNYCPNRMKTCFNCWREFGAGGSQVWRLRFEHSLPVLEAAFWRLPRVFGWLGYL
jgi:hypothetical protein